MSRIGKKPIVIPAGVDVKLDGTKITVKGPKGTLERELHPNMTVEMEGNEINVSRPNDNKENRSLHGLTRTLINNMVTGVNETFKKELEVNGVGYRCEVKGNVLTLKIGYSHDVVMTAPEGVTIEVPNPNKVVVSGPDKQVVGQFAANIREKRPPEPYKGKGIKYSTEVIRRKAGKAGGKK